MFHQGSSNLFAPFGAGMVQPRMIKTSSSLPTIFVKNIIEEIQGIGNIHTVIVVIPDTVAILRPSKGCHCNDEISIFEERWSSTVTIARASSNSPVI